MRRCWGGHKADLPVCCFVFAGLCPLFSLQVRLLLRGDDTQRQVLLHSDLLDVLPRLLDHASLHIRYESLMALRNLTCQSKRIALLLSLHAHMHSLTACVALPSAAAAVCHCV